MKTGDTISRGGFVTQRKFVIGQSLQELERRLGFKRGRFSNGILVAVLTDSQQLPIATDFELRGYSQVADHHHNPSLTDGMDRNTLKNLARQVWEKTGPNSLVKIISITEHDDRIPLDQQYPPGAGVPQWKLVKGLQFDIVAEIKGYPEGRWNG